MNFMSVSRVFASKMSRSLFVIVLSLLCLSGCKTGSNSGRDPLLGKTRLDPPTTNARSVYVERPNVNESGVVPGGRIIAQPSKTSGSSVPQTASNGTRTVNYPDGLDEISPENGKEKSVSENSHLRWRSADEATTENEAGTGTGEQALQNTRSETLTEEELSDYRYVYDFSVTPPRKVPVNRSNSTSTPATADSSVTPDYQRSKLVRNEYDPYAPNRQYERRRENLSKSFAAEFDQEEDSPVNPSSTAYQTPETSTFQATQTVVSTPKKGNRFSPKQASGWIAVATPDVTEGEREVFAQTRPEHAPIQNAVGSQVEIPAPAPKKDVLEDRSIDILSLPTR